ncbi:hypothetical protein B5F07_04655 [Lachnoclostridium sp. An169]|uniref:hypothetical protein n=1 Tax=Lachnoclostridium sp. An169 TaxID=1965569 RepID=UPI000B391232|nr:hypothetical protein [Lachnoclostridium sp. An169]OUP85437.1 hypothetical protein B5F07_04655 [Lachnoclostridium sp. An169]HJA67886.1 hypothetical protein [Candidatus Mediterraneibacter cottocaccae]
MKIGKKELRTMRDDLEKLTEFIRETEKGHLPYFYRCFDTMKNNIEIFFCVGNDEDDIDDFLPVLERDWEASHMMLIGVQDYDLRDNNPDIDPRMCVYFAALIASVAKYFENDPSADWRHVEHAVTG